MRTSLPAARRHARARSLPRSVKRGLSLVELMVGITVGLFIVAAATVMVSSQLGENRRLLLESQLQQDLRATADIITRELRRSGASINAQMLMATASQPAFSASNVSATTPASGVHSPAEITFKYERNGIEQGPWGFKLDNGVIKTQLVSSLTGATAGWQDLTDGTVMEVTQFRVTINREPALEVACPKICPSGDTTCWPIVYVRDFIVEISARLRSAPEVRRSVRSTVRARNDYVEFRTAGATACPA
ncbi:MAG: prepilin-type N-terminal cleavage/methylation domain-containing protein [Rubrivivax sp.]|nr:prepilin-type N-terminal cleavage/methylation domain-containing protein [Rubrivivax sp.]